MERRHTEIMHWLKRLLYLYLYLWTGARAVKTKVFCNRTIEISCNSDLLFIVSTNATSALASGLLEQCNARNSCQVLNYEEICIKIQHWCRKNEHTVEVIRHNIVAHQSNSSSTFLMSHNYREGSYEDAQNISCDISLPQTDEHYAEVLRVFVYEFAPFTNSTEYCLSISLQEEPFCSGSGVLYKALGPNNDTKGWQLNFTLAEASTTAPQIRFWIEIVVNNGDLYSLQCRTQNEHASFTSNTITVSPGFEGTTTTSTNKNLGSEEETTTTQPLKNSVMIILGSCLGFVILVIAVVIGLVVSFYTRHFRLPKKEIVYHYYCDVARPNRHQMANRPLPSIIMDDGRATLVPKISTGLQFLNDLAKQQQSHQDNLSHGVPADVEDTFYANPDDTTDDETEDDVDDDDDDDNDTVIMDNPLYETTTVKETTCDDTDVTSNETAIVDVTNGLVCDSTTGKDLNMIYIVDDDMVIMDNPNYDTTNIEETVRDDTETASDGRQTVHDNNETMCDNNEAETVEDDTYEPVEIRAMVHYEI